MKFWTKIALSKTLENQKHGKAYNNLKLSRWQAVLLLTSLAIGMFVFRIDEISGIDSITASDMLSSTRLA